MPSSETSSALSEIGLRRYPAKFSDCQASARAEFIDFGAQNCLSEALLAGKWGHLDRAFSILEPISSCCFN